MMQVEEPCDTPDFVIVCKNAPSDIIYSQVLHDDNRSDPELYDKEVSFRGMRDSCNPGEIIIKMSIKASAA
jgi:hypothetical protein